MRSSPPYSPPHVTPSYFSDLTIQIPLEDCFATHVLEPEIITPPRDLESSGAAANTPFDKTIPLPQQIWKDPKGPPIGETTFHIWKKQDDSRIQVKIKPMSPVADVNVDDFVMYRRQRQTYACLGEEGRDTIDYRESTVQHPVKQTNSDYSQKQKVTEGEKERNRKPGKKWVRFLDVGISCASDEADDELAFCKPPPHQKYRHGKFEEIIQNHNLG